MDLKVGKRKVRSQLLLEGGLRSFSLIGRLGRRSGLTKEKKRLARGQKLRFEMSYEEHRVWEIEEWLGHTTNT